MTQTCIHCSRLNPTDALFCYYDGKALPGHSQNGGPVASGDQRFPHPFVFSSGQSCGSFDELALCCQQSWEEAKEVLQQGYLETFLGGLGRADLALAAREAARFPDRDRGLDRFLSRLPTKALQPPRLFVEPAAVNLGQLRVGENRVFQLHLKNEGMRLVYGSVACDPSSFLILGDAPGVPTKLFDFSSELTVPVHVQGQKLRAASKPQESQLVIESNGGTATVVVHADVPVQPFAEGVLAGASSPRQIAEKAKASPQEAGVLLENGAVARWYKQNGWAYPIQGPAASGLGAVQQFFEALGLTPPPRVEISEKSVTLTGNPGEKLEHLVEVRAHEPRPVWAHGTSNRSWLEIGRARLEGRTATIPLVVASVPDRPGETLQASVALVCNGNQRLGVSVTLVIAGKPRPVPPPTAGEATTPAAAALAQAIVPPGTVRPSSLPALPALGRWAGWGRSQWLLLLPALLLALVLVGVFVRDFRLANLEPVHPQVAFVDPDPRIAIHMHDGKKGDKLDQLVPAPSMRFGLVMLEAKDPTRGGKPKRLTFDEWGRTNNTCLRVDGTERLFGNPPGRWKDRERQAVTWQDDQGKTHNGTRSIWYWDEQKTLQCTQYVELVRGEQSDLLDTCLVRYALENLDAKEHRVGLRFLLDTYIGANDGVPFTIPGETDLCTTSKDFRETIPDFIQALENEDLADPGTVAHLKLKLGGREPPKRVILGAWPDDNLQQLLNKPEARGADTLWEVPVLPMKTLFPYDSAVVIYWDEKPLPPKGKREVGFAYGIGSVSSSSKLLMTVDGTFKPGGDLTVTALVSNAAAGETLTLVLPPGFQVEGNATRDVPNLPADATSRNRPVTWKVKAGAIGTYELTVESSTGATQSQAITIKASSIFD